MIVSAATTTPVTTAPPVVDPTTTEQRTTTTLPEWAAWADDLASVNKALPDGRTIPQPADDTPQPVEEPAEDEPQPAEPAEDETEPADDGCPIETSEDVVPNTGMRCWSWTHRGIWEVGTGNEQIPPGRYRISRPAEWCYWERLSDFSGDGIIRNNNEVEMQFFIVDILPSDAGFRLNCR